MKISRHARNNMRLYAISEADIAEALAAPDIIEMEGKRLIAVRKFPGRFEGYPLKVVYLKGGDGVAKVVTAYPLKRKHWR